MKQQNAYSSANKHGKLDFHMTSAEDFPIKQDGLGSSTEDQVAWSVDDLKSTEQSLSRSLGDSNHMTNLTLNVASGREWSPKWALSLYLNLFDLTHVSIILYILYSYFTRRDVAGLMEAPVLSSPFHYRCARMHQGQSLGLCSGDYKEFLNTVWTPKICKRQISVKSTGWSFTPTNCKILGVYPMCRDPFWGSPNAWRLPSLPIRWAVKGRSPSWSRRRIMPTDCHWRCLAYDWQVVSEMLCS